MVSPRLTHALRRCAPNTHFARPAYPFRSLATTSRLWTSNATASAAAPAEVTLSALSDKDALEVQWQDNKRSLYGYLWLRDNCQCDQCIHPSNRQKLHSSADIPLDIAPRSVTAKGDLAEVIWNKPLRHGQDSDHVSQYTLSWLQRYANRENCETYRFENLRPQTWDQSQYELDWVDYGDYMHSDEGLHTVVQRLYNKGLVFIDGVPTRDESVTQVAERIGPVYETFYGRDFDVKNVAKSRNIAYTSLYLGFHMDLMYTDSPPGIQLLHSLQNTVTGGASIFVDSYRAVEMLKAQYPDDYQVLTSTPVTFHYVNDGHHMYYRRPTIVAGENDAAWDMHVNYAPQFQGPLDHLSPEEGKRFYRAFQRFADFIEDEKLRFQLTLQPGQLVMFANRRVLHGRTSFDPLSGDRHLKGTYIHLDSLKDKIRTLCEKYGYSNSV